MDFLLLVSKDHPCPADLNPDLVPVHPDWPDILLEKEAADALNRLMDVIDGWKSIVPVSGWRSQEEQQAIWDDSVQENGLEFTRQYVAAPGCSEHQTGLAIDLGEKRPDVDFLCPEFPYTGICQKFRTLAPAFGFIERYPKGKETVTGISHEPWHFRYTGIEAARAMTAKSLCLEEFTG